MIFCLIKKIPLNHGCPPGNTCQWIRDLSPEDRGIVSRCHNVHMGRAGKNSTEISRPTGTTSSAGRGTTSNVSTRNNKVIKELILVLLLPSLSNWLTEEVLGDPRCNL